MAYKKTVHSENYRVVNLCKLIHDVIIIPVSSEPLNIETVERKDKKHKKLNISRTKRAVRWNKKHFS